MWNYCYSFGSCGGRKEKKEESCVIVWEWTGFCSSSSAKRQMFEGDVGEWKRAAAADVVLVIHQTDNQEKSEGWESKGKKGVGRERIELGDGYVKRKKGGRRLAGLFAAEK